MTGLITLYFKFRNPDR